MAAMWLPSFFEGSERWGFGVKLMEVVLAFHPSAFRKRFGG